MVDNKFLVKLGENISRIRKEKGVTQIELSLRCEMDRSNLRRIEAGRTNPSILKLKLIADSLEVGLEEIVKVKGK